MDSPKLNGHSNPVHTPPSNGRDDTDHPPNNGKGDHHLLSSTFIASEKPPKEPRKSRHPALQCLGENLITVATFAGVLAGIALGLGLRSSRSWTKREITYVNFPGELFLNMLKCLILPLIVSSLVSAIGSLDTRLTGKLV